MAPNQHRNEQKITLSLILRSLVFNSYFYVSTFLFLILCLAPLSLLKSPQPMRKAILIYINCIIFMFDKVANVKIEEHGLENIPEDKAFIYCSKHMSNIDALVLYSRSPNLTALAKQELFKVPLLNMVFNKMGVLAINRGAGEAQKQTPIIAKIIADQKLPMIIFAEGTRIPVGERRPLKSGVFYYQENSEIDVIVVAHNSGVFWPKKSWIKKPGTIIFEYHPPLPYGLNKGEFMAEVKKRLVDRSEELIL